MVQTILTTLVPVAFVILLGYVAGHRNLLKVADRVSITNLVLTWLLPSLLFAGVLKTPRVDLLNYRIPLIFLVGLMVPFLAVLLIGQFVLRYDRRTATLKAGILAFPDMVFMGIPILGRLFGPSSLYPILIANLVPSLIIIPLTTLLLNLDSGEDDGGGSGVFLKTLLKALSEPKVWAPLLGIVLVILNLPMPKFVIGSFDLMGTPTTGLSLFVVGLIIAEEKVRLTAIVTFDSLMKNLAHPAFMALTVLVFGVSGVLAREAIVLAAIPTAVITSMFAEQFGVLMSESSTAVLETRVLSFVTIPVVYALTQHL
ncbi:MAG TPA: AEC family transporter [Terriglobales bacterium]|nr:AEC family transporter [Terriglobales bacterium]